MMELFRSIRTCIEDPDRRAVAIIGAVLLVITVLVIIATCQPRPKFDEQGCPQSASDRSHKLTIILIDRTDPLSNSQKVYAKQFANNLLESLEKFERVIVFRIDSASDQNLVPVFNRCFPGHPKDVNPLTENPIMVQTKFKEEFLFPFREIIEQETATASDTTSPIIETILAVSVNAHLDPHIRQFRFVILSDMIQNTRKYSHYSVQPRFSDYQQSALGQENEDFLTSALSNNEVVLLYCWRNNWTPGMVNNHLSFWTDFFLHYGAKLTVMPVK